MEYDHYLTYKPSLISLLVTFYALDEILTIRHVPALNEPPQLDLPPPPPPALSLDWFEA